MLANQAFRVVKQNLYHGMFGPFPLADPTDERQIPIEMLFFGPLLPIGLMTSFPQLCLQLRIRTQRLDRIAQFMAIPVKEPAPARCPMSLAITGVLNEKASATTWPKVS